MLKVAHIRVEKKDQVSRLSERLKAKWESKSVLINNGRGNISTPKEKPEAQLPALKPAKY